MELPVADPTIEAKLVNDLTSKGPFLGPVLSTLVLIGAITFGVIWLITILNILTRESTKSFNKTAWLLAIILIPVLTPFYIFYYYKPSLAK
jgi:hypothetical protein